MQRHCVFFFAFVFAFADWVSHEQSHVFCRSKVRFRFLCFNVLIVVQCAVDEFGIILRIKDILVTRGKCNVHVCMWLRLSNYTQLLISIESIYI